MIIISNKIFNRLNVCSKRNFGLILQANNIHSFKINLISKLNNYKENNLRKFSVYFNKNYQKQKQSGDGHKSIIESSFQDSNVSTNVKGTQKAKQAAKDFGNGLIILGGAGLLLGIFYILFSELFSRESPSGIYDESSKICLDDPRVQDALGHPIKVHAESGGRRVFQIKHKIYLENGQMFMILNYYLDGPRNKGDVYVKCKKSEKTGKFEYEHIVVKLEYIHNGERKIIVRNKDSNL